MTEKYLDKGQTTAKLLVETLKLDPVYYWCQVEWNEFWVYGIRLPPRDNTEYLARLHRKGDNEWRNESRP